MKFPGESSGLILPPSKWNVSEVATMAYGYGLNATVLQLADAYAMLANKGVKVPLSLYKLEEQPQGEQMIDPQIAEQVLLMMETATLPGGTATRATVPGYRVAGKTVLRINCVPTVKVIRPMNTVLYLPAWHQSVTHGSLWWWW